MRNYSLRYYLSPFLDFDKRMDNLISFCDEAEIDDVMFFIGAEEVYLGHITKEQAKIYVETILKAKEILSKKGITVSLNPWLTVGHWYGGRELQGGQNFRTMIGYDGTDSKVVACPLCENWREYYIDLMNYYIEAIKPKTLWFEDDFRLSNHEPVSLGCFCEEHVKLFNEKAGTNFDREGVVKAIFSDDRYRKIYLDLARLSFEDTMETISSNIKSPSSFGLMTGGPCLGEGKRFSKLFDIMRNNSKSMPYNRICLCSYRQKGLQEYAWSFNASSMFVRFLTGNSAHCVSEMENVPYSYYTKTANYTKYQLLTTAPLRLTGDTLNIFDMNGNGVTNYKKYAEALKSVKPYLSAVTDLKLENIPTSGVYVLVNENSAYTEKGAKTFVELNPQDCWIYAYLTQLGFNCAYTSNVEMCGKTIACSGQVLRNYTNDEIKRLFSNNTLIITGECIDVLKDKKLLDLVNVAEYDVLKERSGTHTIEEWALKDDLYGIDRYRANFQLFCGDYYDIKYGKNSPKKVYTNVVDQYEKIVGTGIVKTGNVVMLPYQNVVTEVNLPISLICPLRAEAIKRAIIDTENNDEIFFVEGETVCIYTYNSNECIYAVLVNFADDGFDEINMSSNYNINDVEILTPNIPSFKKVEIVKKGNKYVIKHELKAQESVVLKIK